MSSGRLYVIPTPIGNLKDISYRAVEVLKSLDLVYAEDTRQSIKLFQHYGIETKLKAYHKFNEHQIVSEIINELKAGRHFGLVSDGGTPAISDPGFLLVRACLDEHIQVETLTGATAFMPALVNAGFPCNEFSFYGFLPQKKGRAKKLTEILEDSKTIILYESPHRLVKLLSAIYDAIGDDRMISISREISKLHEENVRGTARELLTHFKPSKIKGELVVVIAKQ